MKRILFVALVTAAVFARAEYLPVTTTCPTIHVESGAHVEVLTGSDDKCDVYITSEKAISEVKLVWDCDFSGAKLLGDHWERAYGDLAWRDVSGRRIMPWCFLCKDGARTDGYGVMVQPNAFASWTTDGKTLTLTLDVRAGGLPVELKGRRLKAVTIVSRKGRDGESAFAAGQAFCRMMCPNPRLPKEPVYGYNDWYCAYGDQTYAKFLRDLKPVVSLADGLKNRPFAVIDDGWQKNNPVEFTRVHALGMRAIQNGTFFQADPDCVGLASAGAIDWRNNAAWTAAASRWGDTSVLSFFVAVLVPGVVFMV